VCDEGKERKKMQSISMCTVEQEEEEGEGEKRNRALVR
jgi:hypothetical protein